MRSLAPRIFPDCQSEDGRGINLSPETGASFETHCLHPFRGHDFPRAGGLDPLDEQCATLGSYREPVISNFDNLTGRFAAVAGTDGRSEKLNRFPIDGRGGSGARIAAADQIVNLAGRAAPIYGNIGGPAPPFVSCVRLVLLQFGRVSAGNPPHRLGQSRSEERRVGKECTSRWSPDH